MWRGLKMKILAQQVLKTQVLIRGFLLYGLTLELEVMFRERTLQRSMLQLNKDYYNKLKYFWIEIKFPPPPKIIKKYIIKNKATRKRRVFWYISKERSPHKGVLFDKVDTNYGIVTGSMSIQHESLYAL